ncbi:MAG: DUF3299 domain-containing protein [Rhodobacteraceae bacterium]|jgi:hypothetical protein|nr:DUF3299 domain-containing protein [Paracoccaceae bacterium]
MVTRRSLLAALAASAVIPQMLRADEFIDLDWVDLLPKNDTPIPQAFRGLIDHDQPPLSSPQPDSSGVRSDWNGQIVRLPGFVVPIDQSSAGVTAFILVPYAGACVHVPPPPANQLVFVTTETPYKSKGLYEAVNVIGMFGISSMRTYIADVGYALSADKIEPFRV